MMSSVSTWLGEVDDQVTRQRIGHAQLEEGGLGKDFTGVLVGHAVADDAEPAVAPLDMVQGRGFDIFLQPFKPSFQGHALLASVGGQHDVFLRVAVEGSRRWLLGAVDLVGVHVDERLGMGDARRWCAAGPAYQRSR